MAERRNRLLAYIAERWRSAPPSGFVVAAGIATPAPAIAGLLHRVARMQRGMVVLPDLDLNLSPEEWDSIGPFDPDPVSGSRRRAIETHPQFALKLLLDRMSVHRRSEEHTSELQSLMRISYAVFCLKKKTQQL